MTRRRALAAFLPVVLLCTVVTAGCTGEEPSACAPEGDLASAVTVTGDLGGAVDLTSPVPIPLGGPQRDVLIAGEKGTEGGVELDASVTVFSTESGRRILSEKVSLDDDGPGLQRTLRTYARCSEAGARVAVIDQAAAVLGEDGIGAYGLGQSENLLLVIDYVNGCSVPVARDEKYPRVALGDGSTPPTIEIPACMAPPSDLEVTVLEKGEGPVIDSGQQIMTNYVGVDWDGAARFDESWTETGIPLSTATGALIEGFTRAMVGQRIGSTVLVTIPPALGYDDGMTRTFVLQLLSVQE